MWAYGKLEDPLLGAALGLFSIQVGIGVFVKCRVVRGLVWIVVSVSVVLGAGGDFEYAMNC